VEKTGEAWPLIQWRDVLNDSSPDGEFKQAHEIVSQVKINGGHKKKKFLGRWFVIRKKIRGWMIKKG
jgi:glutamate synthase domain-containing protein 1